MTIAEAREKCKTFAARVPRDVLVVGVLLFACSGSFGFGYLAGVDAGQGSEHTVNIVSPTSGITTVRQVVASKSGTKYYLPECSGADRISDSNKIWFVSPDAARAAGYAPAANCNGI